jgi:N-acetylglutamate synthase-like GNAT family acetyltransferase
MDVQIERAKHGDLDAMAAVLEESSLSPIGILARGSLYWVCRTERGVVGVCGLELGDGCALLRSVCVTESHRGKGIAERLIICAMREALHRQLQDIPLQ